VIYTVTLNPALDKEYTVNRIEYDEVLRATTVRINYGGKGFNVSRMLHSLGGSSVALGFVGGKTGRIIQRGLSAEGIETDFTEIDGETRTNISIVNESDRHHIKVNEPGPAVSAGDITRFMDLVERKVVAGDWWVLSGSLPPGAPDGLYSHLIHKIQGRGAFALLDTSGAALKAGLEARPHLIKPNAREVSQIIHRAVTTLEDMQKALPDLYNLGAAMVVISAGRQGALIGDGKEHWFQPAQVIQEGNPIGAGDAMVAGLVWRLSKNDTPKNALAWAVACGTAQASLYGTDMPTRVQVEQFLV